MKWIPRMSVRRQLAISGAALLVLGGAGGAGAMALMRPHVEMAPTVTTAIAKLPSASGIVTVRGRVAEVYGDRFILQDPTGRVLVDAGTGANTVSPSGSVMVQGRYDHGQLKARFLVDGSGNVEEVGPPAPQHGPGPGPGAGHDGPPPPPPGRGGPALPPSVVTPPAPGGAAPASTPPAPIAEAGAALAAPRR